MLYSGFIIHRVLLISESMVYRECASLKRCLASIVKITRDERETPEAVMVAKLFDNIGYMSVLIFSENSSYGSES